jgi:hypothetical protein
MFIITIVVLGMFIYLFNINSRINNLENKFRNHTPTITDKVLEKELIPEVRKETVAPSQPEVPFEPEIQLPHQDNFAKNLAKFGIAVLVLGVLFFLNYIDSQGWIGPVFKYIAGLSFGVVLLGIAEYIKDKNKTYTNLLRGGSFVIFYLTLFVGYIVFQIVSLPVTLGLIIAVLAISTLISLRENDGLPFTLGSLGAYFVPLLIQLNYSRLSDENVIGLMTYLVVLNIAIIFISFKKEWIASSIFGFIFTWSIFTSILYTDIGKNLLFIFSTIYGLQYLIIFLTYDFQKVKSVISNVAESIVFLTVVNTIVYLMVFYKLIDKTILFDYVGFFVALLGVFHFMVYMILRKINKSSSGVVTLTHFVISILLVSVAVPLQFDGPLVTMIWFMEGVALSFLSVLKDFKNKPVMYALGFLSIVAGIVHMISFGVYESVLKTGYIFLNQSYIVWFAVFVLINIVAYIWYNTVEDSEDFEFKKSINSTAFALIIIGQVLFVGLTATEINNFGQYRENIINKEISEQRNLDSKLEGNNYQYNYDTSKYKAEYDRINSIERQTTFMQLLLFMFLTIIYFLIGLVKKNKTVRNMGIVTLVITSVLLITLTWSLGPVYRIITFVGFGVALLIVSYFYISKNAKSDIAKTMLIFLMPLLAATLFSTTADAKVIDIKNWTTLADLKMPEIEIQGDNQNLYVVPIDKDIVTLSKKNDLSDIRIIDKDKNEIPYILVKSNQNNQNVSEEKKDVKILENSITRDGKRFLVLDTNREGVLYNNLYLSRDIKSVNFRKKVKVYISDSFLTANSSAWREFEQKNVVYNYTDGTNFMIEDLDINLSGISSRYVKLELTDDTDFDKNIKVNNKVSIASVQVKYIKDENKSVGFKIKDYLSGNFVFDNLSIYKDVKLLNNAVFENRSELTFEGDIDTEELILQVDSSERNFNRNILLQGTNDDIDWPIITNTNIYRIDSLIYKGEKLSIKLPPSTFKKFRVIIQNNNDKPLSVEKTAKVKIQNTGVIFKIDNSVNISDLKIIVGNNIDLSPIYDIKSIINYFEESTPQIIEYQNLISNPEYVPAKNIIPFGERNKVFLNIGLLLFILIVGIFGFFWMKKEKYEEIENNEIK